ILTVSGGACESECRLRAMEEQQPEVTSHKSNENPALDGRVVAWIEEESNLICDLASLDATFDLVGSREARNRSESREETFLYSDYLEERETTRAETSPLVLIRREKRRKEEEKLLGLFSKTEVRNVMIVTGFVIFFVAFLVDYNLSKELAADSQYRRWNDPSNHWLRTYFSDIEQWDDAREMRLDNFIDVFFVYSKSIERSSKWKNILVKMERFLRYHRPEIKFHIVRCFDEDNSCREIFGLQQKAPAVVIHNERRFHVYAGRLSIDHVFAWIERMISPIEIIFDLEDYYHKFLKYDVTFTAHFPFSKSKDGIRTNARFPGFERVARARMTGTPDSHRTRFFVVLNRTLAEYLKIENPGTVLFQSLLGRYEYLQSGYKESELGSYVHHWDRASFRVPFVYKGLHHNNRFKIQSNRYFTKIVNGTTVVLFTRHEPLYYPGTEDVNIFREISLEYSDCDLRPEWQWRVPKKIYHPRRYALEMNALNIERQQRMMDDRRKLEKTRLDESTRSCCHSLSLLRSMDDLCSSCRSSPEKGCDETRWQCNLDLGFLWKLNANSTNLFDSEVCEALHGEMSEERIVNACCKDVLNVDKSGRNSDIDDDRLRAWLNEDAFRAFLARSQGNKERKVSDAGLDAPRNKTLWKKGCQVDPALRFVIVDMKKSPSLARRFGLDPQGPPRVAIIDAAEERTSVMESQFNRETLRRFVASFYTGEMQWTAMNKGDFTQHRRDDTNAGGEVIEDGKEVMRMKELDHDGFTQLTRKTMLDRDSILFLTGGASHAASMVLHFQVYETMQFFRQRGIHIDFYSYDVTVNEVPYNFKMSRFPSVYFLPADRPLDSLDFPSGLQFTSSNLVFYALASLSYNVRWQTLLNEDKPNPTVIRHLRQRIDEMERSLRRRRMSQEEGEESTRLITSRLRASRLLLSNLQERHSSSSEDLIRAMATLQKSPGLPLQHN
ncbi:hypothetical protein PFISCL1PPCAC_26483, partial [Pristionchus fissidentatus]